MYLGDKSITKKWLPYQESAYLGRGKEVVKVEKDARVAGTWGFRRAPGVEE